MSETKPNETKPKKTVSASVAIALGIVFIVVVAGLVGAFACYANDKNNTISALNTQKYQLYGIIANLQNQVNDFNETLKLRKVDPWTDGWIFVSQAAGSYSSWNYPAPYAGAIEFLVEPPAKNSVYIRVLWNCSVLGVQYDYQTFGHWENGRAYAAFPVLPTSNVEIRVGNTFPSGEVRFFLLFNYWY